MKTFQIKRVVYLLSLFTFGLVTLGSSFSRAQGPCFTVSAPVGPQQPACSGPCIIAGAACNHCYDYTIKSSCDGEQPDSFKIDGNGGCFSFCSPNGDFKEPDYRTNCDPNAKWAVWQQAYPITTTQGGVLRICAPAGTKLTFRLVHHNGPSPCNSPCDTVDILQP